LPARREIRAALIVPSSAMPAGGDATDARELESSARCRRAAMRPMPESLSRRPSILKSLPYPLKPASPPPLKGRGLRRIQSVGGFFFLDTPENSLNIG
jgi:hypothetical protein